MSPSTLNYVLQHITATMHRQTDQMLQERLGVGVAQFKILTTLQERPAVQQRFLADSLGQTEASISRQIKLLAEKGLLTVQTSSESKRENITLLTPKGVKLTQAAREIVDTFHQPAFDQLSEKEHQQLTEILQCLHLHCCREGKPFACAIPWFVPE